MYLNYCGRLLDGDAFCLDVQKEPINLYWRLKEQPIHSAKKKKKQPIQQQDTCTYDNSPGSSHTFS